MSRYVRTVDKFIQEAARTVGARVVLAVEAGSRSWGLSSPRSDYDIHLVYVYPRDRYLSLEAPPSTFEVSGVNVDEHKVSVAGWDIRKALRLFGESNPSVIEWLQVYGRFGEDSRHVYEASGPFAEDCLDLLPRVVDLHRLFLAHRQQFFSRYEAMKFVLAKSSPRGPKEILHLAREFLMAEHIRLNNELPPVGLGDLLEAASIREPELCAMVRALRAARQGGAPDDPSAVPPAMRSFFAERVIGYSKLAPPPAVERPVLGAELDRIFRASVLP